MTIKGFRFEPVAWAGSALALLVAVETVNEAAHLLPGRWTPWLLGAIAVLTALTTGAVRARTTAVAAPRDSAGTPLVPKWAAQDSPTPPIPPGAGGGVGGAGMRSW